MLNQFVHRCLLFGGFACALWLVSGQTVTAQTPSKPAGAKALFYDPVSGTLLTSGERQKKTSKGQVRVRPTAPTEKIKFPGIHYWIELEGHGAVTDDYIFHTGDRIKLYVRSNTDGYLSLWTLDSSGRGKRLYPPTTETDTASLLKADVEFSPLGFIRFGPPAEDERLLVFFSRDKQDQPPGQVKTLSQDFIAKASPKGSKELVFETEKTAPAEVGTYVINRQGGPLAKEILLKHQAPKP